MPWAYVAPALLLGFTFAMPQAHALTEDEELGFVEEIIFRKKLINNGQTALRWDRQPTFSVVEGNDRQNLAFDTALSQLERPLRPVGFRIRRLGPDVDTADITVRYLKFSDLPRVLMENELPAKFARLNMVHPVYDESGTLQRVFIFIDSRLAQSDEAMQRQALKLTLASIGLGGETSLPIQSIFFEIPPGGIGGEPPNRLSSLDIRAIRLMYAYLQPGAMPGDLAAVFDQYWGRLL